MIAQLADPKEGIRHRAATQIRAAREAAVGPLLAALADPRQANLHPAVLAVFTQFGDEAAGPLSAALRSPNEAIALAAAQRSRDGCPPRRPPPNCWRQPLRAIRSRRCASRPAMSWRRILGHRATAEEAREFFRSDIRRLLDQARKERDVADPTASTWRWDEKASASVLVNLPPADLAVETAARYARRSKQLPKTLPTSDSLCWPN